MDKQVQEKQIRSQLSSAKRIVIKVGTRVLTGPKGELDRDRISILSEQIAQLCKNGVEVALVSSGAIAAGLKALGIKKRPDLLPELQMAAAVGQSNIIQEYSLAFKAQGLLVAQVLLTRDGLSHRERHLNTRNTMRVLLRKGVVPVVNENDTVSVDELKFGDNDMLAALTAIMLDADALVILSSVEGLYRNFGAKRQERVSFVSEIGCNELGMVLQETDDLSIGGMESKLEATQVALQAGVPVLIASGKRDEVLREIISGKQVGTAFAPSKYGVAVNGEERIILAKKKWLAFFPKTQGILTVDAGAARQLLSSGSSLLPAGIVSISGNFEIGALVKVLNPEGRTVARGLVGYSSGDIAKILGLKSHKIKEVLGRKDYDEVIHRDNMLVFA